MNTEATNSLPDLDAFAAAHNLAAIGVADLDALRRAEPEAMASAPTEFPRGIALGIRLADAILDEIEDRPTPLYFHLYRQANYALDRAAFELALILQRAGHRALPVPASQIIGIPGTPYSSPSRASTPSNAADGDKYGVPGIPPRGLLSHRLVGHQAGLGWIGRPTLLVHPQFGARMRYATVLTDAPYPPGQPVENGCGECRRCIVACPAGAVHESSREFDLPACFATLDQFRKLPFIGQHICGICIRECKGPECV